MAKQPIGASLPKGSDKLHGISFDFCSHDLGIRFYDVASLRLTLPNDIGGAPAITEDVSTQRKCKRHLFSFVFQPVCKRCIELVFSNFGLILSRPSRSLSRGFCLLKIGMSV